MALLSPGKRGGTRNRFDLGTDRKVIEMTEKGVSAKAIAEAVGRTANSVRYRQRWLRDSDMSTLPALKKFHEERGTA